MTIKIDQEQIRASRSGKWAALLYGVSAFSLFAAMPAYAQENGDAPVETTVDEEEDDTARQDEIVVRGIRSSLESAQAIKRTADTFVDAVTAEDIGALPDRSVTEALQRVPGVSISRFAAADDPDHFSIEGQGVLVRGLTFVRSELNGRDTFSANNGRSLSFSDVPPELLGSVQVFKNQTADLIEGGIAGSVNLVTRKPFDKDGQVIAGAIEYNYGDFREEWTPTASVLYSNVFDTDAGKFGFLINGVYSELKSRSDGTQISAFRPRTDYDLSGPMPEAFFPEGASLRTQEYDRERIGYGGSVQWESTDRKWLATAEFLRSEATTAWTENVVEVATDNVTNAGGAFLVPGTEYGIDSNGLFSYGQITAPIGWRDDQFSGDPRTPIYGLQSNNQRRGVDQTYVTQDASFNLKWSPNDKWSFNFDYQFIDSTVENVDFTIWGSTFQDVRLDLRPEIPIVELLPPSEGTFGRFAGGSEYICDANDTPGQSCPTYYRPGNDSFADPYNTFWRAAMDHLEDSEGQEKAFRADVDYDFDDLGPITKMRFGYRWAERDQTTRFSTYNWGALSEIWAGGGPIWADEIGAPDGNTFTFGFPNFMRGEGTTLPTYVYSSFNPAQDYLTAADWADSVVAQWLANRGLAAPAGGGDGWRRLSDRPGTVDGTYLPGEISDVTETNKALYIRFDYDFGDIGNGITLDGNFGLRYFETDLVSGGAYQFPEPGTVPEITGLPSSSDPDTPGGQNRCLAPLQNSAGTDGPSDGQPGVPQTDFIAPSICSIDPAVYAQIVAFADGGFVNVDAKNGYDMFLPSFNAKLGLNDDMLIRFAYSKSISRPDVGSLRNYFTMGILTADDPRTDVTEANAPGFYGFSAAGGNPFLEPVKSDNYDLSFEWYFADVGSLTFSVFYKEIEDIIVGGQGDIAFSNNGVTFNNVFTRQPTNSAQKGEVQGLEIAYQQFYDFLPEPFDGFGIQATYTYIDSSGVDSSRVGNTSSTPGGTIDPNTGQQTNSALVDLSQFPLEGLSEHNYNLAGIYEKGPISARLVYNWRSEYLVTGRDVITPFYPIFQNASGQLDGSLFYTVNDNVKIGIQGANLLDEVTETTSFIPNSGGLKGPRSFFMNDRRITLSARFSF